MTPLDVSVVGPNIATVSGPGIPAATYKLDHDGMVKQFQHRRGRDLWVAVHSERIIEAVKCAFAVKGKYATVNLMTGEIAWTGEADSPEQACEMASGNANVKKLHVSTMKGAFGVYKLPDDVDVDAVKATDTVSLEKLPHVGNFITN